VPTGTISGRVISSDDAPLPGVTVIVTSPNLQGERTVVTTDNGDFVIPLLPPGDYTVVFELSGFQSVKRQVGLAGTQSVILNERLRGQRCRHHRESARPAADPGSDPGSDPSGRSYGSA
jgi:hypothetical protein